MKKSTFIFFIIFLAAINIQAQNYLISFAGAGDTTVVTTVKVDNLTSGATVTIDGGDILHLTSTVGISNLALNNRSIHVYPNPMEEKSVLTFIAPEGGNAEICIVDLSGKTVNRTNMLLSAGAHSFRIAGVNQGIYLVKVSSKNYFCSTKLISQNNPHCETVIEYISSVYGSTGNPLKSSAATIDMLYSTGDQLIFKGMSGIYSTIVPDVPVSSKLITFNFVECTDADNTNYSIVHIGTQTWMAENLNVGVRIDDAQYQTNNGIIEKYCYNNDVNNCNTYGGLYQWNEMMQYVFTPGVKGICPVGWHIPTDAQLTTLTAYLGGESLAGGKMKSTGTLEAGNGLWKSPNSGATNESGFSAVPAGSRLTFASFFGIDWYGDWWSSSMYSSYAWFHFVSFDNNDASRGNSYLNDSFSVRCVRD